MTASAMVHRFDVSTIARMRLGVSRKPYQIPQVETGTVRPCTRKLRHTSSTKVPICNCVRPYNKINQATGGFPDTGAFDEPRKHSSCLSSVCSTNIQNIHLNQSIETLMPLDLHLNLPRSLPTPTPLQSLHGMYFEENICTEEPVGYFGLQHKSRCKIPSACLQQLLSGFKPSVAAGVLKP